MDNGTRRDRRRSSARRKSTKGVIISGRAGSSVRSSAGLAGDSSGLEIHSPRGVPVYAGGTYRPKSPFFEDSESFSNYSDDEDPDSDEDNRSRAAESAAGTDGGQSSARGDGRKGKSSSSALYEEYGAYNGGPSTNRNLVGHYASDRVLKPQSKAALKIQRAVELEPDAELHENMVVEGTGSGGGSHDNADQPGAAGSGANGGGGGGGRGGVGKANKPIRVREAISYVKLRQDRRTGWLSLWGFMCFAALFIVMLNVWYDVRTLARTQRSFARYFNEVEYEIGKGPQDVKTGDDVWKYLQAVVEKIYNNTEYGYTSLPSERGHIMRYTKVLDTFTITKLGVAQEECTPPSWADGRHHIFRNTVCYRLPDSWFGTKDVVFEPIPFKLSDGRDANIQKIVDAAQVQNFLDDATTEVKIQFWFYNPQTQYTIRVRAYFAFNVFGLVQYDGLRVFPIRLFPYEKSKDYFVAVCQGLYGIALLRFLYVEIMEMVASVREEGGFALGMLGYWSSLWNVVDWITAALGMTGMVFHVVYLRGKGRENLLNNEGADFGLEWIPDLSRYTLGLAAMFYSWKTLHYFDFEPRVAMLIKTLELAWPTLTFYAASLVVIMLGYAIGGYLIVGGTGLEEFSTFASAFQSCLRMTTGEISLETIWPNEAAHPATKFAVSIFYWTFVLLVFFILLNMFIAIILDSYTMQTQQQQIGSGGGASSASAHHKNLLLFFLDGVRVIKEYVLTKVFRRANGSMPKVCEDHAYVYLVELHNSGQVLVVPDDIRMELKDTPGGENIVNWLYHLQHPDDNFAFDPLIELGVKKAAKKDTDNESNDSSVDMEDLDMTMSPTGVAVRI